MKTYFKTRCFSDGNHRVNYCEISLAREDGDVFIIQSCACRLLICMSTLATDSLVIVRSRNVFHILFSQANDEGHQEFCSTIQT